MRTPIRGPSSIIAILIRHNQTANGYLADQLSLRQVKLHLFLLLPDLLHAFLGDDLKKRIQARRLRLQVHRFISRPSAFFMFLFTLTLSQHSFHNQKISIKYHCIALHKKFESTACDLIPVPADRRHKLRENELL